VKIAISFSDTPSFVAPKVAGPFNNTQLAYLWFDWVAELGGAHEYDLVVLAPEQATLPKSLQAWRSVTRLYDRHQISAWPQGPNLVIQQLIWWQLLNKIEEPIFWVEADAIPLSANWIKAWEAEYLRGKKPFMGGLVTNPPGHPGTPPHMTGVGIYPPYAGKYADKLLQAMHTAFDVWAAPQILPQLHETHLIQHLWRHGPIETMADYEKVIDPRANLFHSDKYGALIRLLRSQRTGKVEEPDAGQLIRAAFGTEPPPPPAAPLFLDPDHHAAINGEFNTPEGLANITKTPEPEPPPEAEEEPIMPKGFALERLFQRIRDLVITEEDRIKLLEFLRDEHFFQIKAPDHRGGRKKKNKPLLAGNAK
jgi:hypothetical protein